MTNEDHNPLTDTDLPPDVTPADDDLRFAPAEEDADLPAEGGAPEFSMSGGVDIEAALAAVASLSDVLAEQEAAEQARIAQADAEARAADERRMRLEHPEMFFPVPPQAVLRRGQMASVVPALLLMGIGAWLTFALTASPTALSGAAIAAVLVGGIGVALLARWLSSGRWARGSLFVALALLLVIGVGVYLVQPAAAGLPRAWPLLLVAIGAAFVLTALLAHPPERRLLLPGAALAVAGAAALVVTLELLPAGVVAAAATLWPVALALVLLVWLLPALRRR